MGERRRRRLVQSPPPRHAKIPLDHTEAGRDVGGGTSVGGVSGAVVRSFISPTDETSATTSRGNTRRGFPPLESTCSRREPPPGQIKGAVADSPQPFSERRLLARLA